MKGTYTSLNNLRRQVFEEVARLAYEQAPYEAFNDVPYHIISGEYGTYRDSVFLERAVVRQRIRLAVGLSPHRANENQPVSKGVEAADRPECYYEPPLINVIKFACNDQSLCIKCGRCIRECPYGAIIRQERPCRKACGVDAIRSDEHGLADIDYDKCVSCGMCLVNCPFGAIADKSQIYQCIQAIHSEEPVYAIVAPAIAGQFGPKCTPDKLRPLFRALGFNGVWQVSAGADICTLQEAEEFLKLVPEKQPFMGTSCCPAWSAMAKKLVPEHPEMISMALTPMVFTGRMVKRKFGKDCKVCFVGPCAAKKLEAQRKTIRSDVDFVLTFEELAGMIAAKGIEFDQLESEPWDSIASGDGEGFAQSGGVAQAVVNRARELEPDKDVKTMAAEGLENCKKMVMMAKTGKLNGYLLEGMACPGGCIAGAGTIQPVAKSKASLAKAVKEAPFARCSETSLKEAGKAAALDN